MFLAPGGRFRLTPLYDVVSAQPSVDAGQLRRNQMKLAMAAGDNRHYVVDRIALRHFIQTAAKAGIGAWAVKALFEDIAARAPAAIDAVMAGLPRDFPIEIVSSIIGGFRNRLRETPT